MTGRFGMTAVTERLDWQGFTARYFAERRRHDLEALSSYAAYKHGGEWPKSGHPAPTKLTLVPNEKSEGTAAQRLLVAVQAVQVWEGEGGFAP
jgi:hypothetical protein